MRKQTTKPVNVARASKQQPAASKPVEGKPGAPPAQPKSQLRFAALRRVSTERQEKEGESLRTQTQDIKQTVAELGGRPITACAATAIVLLSGLVLALDQSRSPIFEPTC